MAARSYTRAELRARAREYANHANDLYPADSVYNELIDVANGRYWELLIDSGEGYTAQTTVEWTTDGTTGTKALATGVGRLIGVEYKSSATWWTPVKKMHPRDLTKYPTTGTLARAWWKDGDSIQLVPIPASGKVYRYRYYAAPAKLAADASTVDGYDGLEDYIPLDVAIKIGIKERKDVSALVMLRQDILDRIEKARMQAVMFEPGRVRDTQADEDNDTDDDWEKFYE